MSGAPEPARSCISFRTPTSPWLTRPESPVLRAWRRTPRTPSCTRRTWLHTSCENMSGRNIVFPIVQVELDNKPNFPRPDVNGRIRAEPTGALVLALWEVSQTDHALW